MQRVFLAGRSGQTCPLSGGAELRHFAGNRFELERKIEPNSDFLGNCGAKAPLFLWSRGAQTRCFQGEKKKLQQPEAVFFAAIGGFSIK